MKKGMISIMLNFLKKKCNHSCEEILWYKYFDYNGLKVLKSNYCPTCKTLWPSHTIYKGKYFSFDKRQQSINKWISYGAIDEEEFAFKYR